MVCSGGSALYGVNPNLKKKIVSDIILFFYCIVVNESSPCIIKLKKILSIYYFSIEKPMSYYKYLKSRKLRKLITLYLHTLIVVYSQIWNVFKNKVTTPKSSSFLKTSLLCKFSVEQIWGWLKRKSKRNISLWLFALKLIKMYGKTKDLWAFA